MILVIIDRGDGRRVSHIKPEYVIGDFAIHRSLVIEGRGKGLTVTHMPSGLRMPTPGDRHGNPASFTAVMPTLRWIKRWMPFITPSTFQQQKDGTWHVDSEFIQAYNRIARQTFGELL